MKAAVALLLLCCAGSAACGAPDTPEETARAFLARVSRDPIGTLPLLSEDFHGRHGLRHTLPGASETLLSRRAAPLPSEPVARRRELSGAQLGWLILQGQEAVRAQARFRALELVEAEQEGDRARVAFRVAFAGAPELVQRFELVRRDARSRWQVDRVTQEGVGPVNVPHAFALAPSAELLRKATAWQNERFRP